MDKKNIIIMVVVAVVFGGIGFWGGIKYGQSPAALKKLTPAQMQAAFAGARTGAAGGAGFAGRGSRAGGAAGGFVTGQIISQDATSITVQLPNNGGSKIVFLSSSSQIMKSTAGAVTDLTTGETVTVTGTTNSDGSVTAQNIAIRPTTTTPPAAQ